MWCLCQALFRISRCAFIQEALSGMWDDQTGEKDRELQHCTFIFYEGGKKLTPHSHRFHWKQAHFWVSYFYVFITYQFTSYITNQLSDKHIKLTNQLSDKLINLTYFCQGNSMDVGGACGVCGAILWKTICLCFLWNISSQSSFGDVYSSGDAIHHGSELLSNPTIFPACVVFNLTLKYIIISLDCLTFE